MMKVVYFWAAVALLQEIRLSCSIVFYVPITLEEAADCLTDDCSGGKYVICAITPWEGSGITRFLVRTKGW
jgi:hypothetical protein